MSKKDKSKFKRQLKAKILEDMAKTQDPDPKLVQDKPIQTSKVAEVHTHSGGAAAAELGSEIDLAQIKYDLKKTAIVVGSLAIIIGILYYLDLKYGILLTFGNWLFKSLNIS